MRADFYDRPAQYREFGALLENHHTLITPMSLSDLINVVLKPAQLPDVGLTFDEGLVTELVFAVREEASALPLMQFTLDLLFERREGNRLTRVAYEAMGGVKGALAKHAENTFQGLTEAQQRLARTLFLRLIEPGATPQDTTRRRAQLGELELADPEQTEQMRAVMDTFVRARLVTTDRSGAVETLEVSHEALIREWKQLGGWLHYAREDILVQRNVAQDAAAWRARGRPAVYDGFYRGSILLEKQAWALRFQPSADEIAFIQASETDAERQSAAERERQVRELELAQEAASNAQRAEAAEKARAAAEKARATRFQRWLLVAGAAIVIALVLLGISFSQLNSAQFASTVSAFEGMRIATRVPGLGQLPPTVNPTVPPQEAFATATQIASAYGHDDDVIERFEGVEMVQVPKGCFFMGTTALSDTTPITQVCFDEPYWIDRFEVTQRQFEQLGGEMAAEFTFPGDNRPVENITWFKARDYCNTRDGSVDDPPGVGTRLPTEAEWEYAAAGPDSYSYPWGREFPDDIEDYAVFNQSATADVGEDIREAGRSWVGAYDMSGNVWEWVNSLYLPYDSQEDREADTGDRTDVRRVLRGGSFINSGNSLRAANRFRDYPDFDFSNFGFRCARSS